MSFVEELRITTKKGIQKIEMEQEKNFQEWFEKEDIMNLMRREAEKGRYSIRIEKVYDYFYNFIDKKLGKDFKVFKTTLPTMSIDTDGRDKMFTDFTISWKEK